MENFKDLPLWRQCYKIAFPEQYNDDDTYEQAEFKKAYKMRDLVGGVLSNDIIPDKNASYKIGDSNFSFDDVYANHLFQYVGAGSYTYDNIINNNTKLNTINNLEFSYTIKSSRYFSRTTTQTYDNLGLFRKSNYGDYITLITLKLDNLNRRVKALEANK